MMTTPTWVKGRSYNEVSAVALYSAGTKVDPSAAPDTIYPPNDQGSTGLDVCTAGVDKGYLKEYRHCSGLTETLTVLQFYPVMIGSNWYDSMDNTDGRGNVSISPNAQVRGGHEYYLGGLDPLAQTVQAWNSWGVSWGVSGAFHISFADLDRLLNEQGDSIVPLTV